MIKEYMTEELLGKFLEERSDINFLTKKRFKIRDDVTVIPDYVSEDGKIFVEFDGTQHYTQTSRAFRDLAIQEYCEENHITLIQLPYFVQLNSEEIVSHFFGDIVEDVSPFNDYPHGFIDKKVVYPCDFCGDGLYRYQNDINLLPKSVSDQIQATEEDYLDSLNKKYKSR